MVIDIPSKSSRRRKKVPTISKRAIINKVQDVISQICPRLLRERNILCFTENGVCSYFFTVAQNYHFLFHHNKCDHWLGKTWRVKINEKRNIGLFFSRQLLSCLTFLKVVCLQNSLSERLVGHVAKWKGHYLLNDITLKNVTQDVLVRFSLIPSDHSVKLARYFQNFINVR